MSQLAEVEFVVASENVRSAVGAEPGEVRVGHVLGQDGYDEVAFNSDATPGDLASRTEHHAVGLGASRSKAPAGSTSPER